MVRKIQLINENSFDGVTVDSLAWRGLYKTKTFGVLNEQDRVRIDKHNLTIENHEKKMDIDICLYHYFDSEPSRHRYNDYREN